MSNCESKIEKCVFLTMVKEVIKHGVDKEDVNNYVSSIQNMAETLKGAARRLSNIFDTNISSTQAAYIMINLKLNNPDPGFSNPESGDPEFDEVD